MITAQTITRKYRKDVRCIWIIGYYLIIDDGADEILAQNYSLEQAWDEAANKVLGDEVRRHVRQARKEAFTEASVIVQEQQHGPNPEEFGETLTKLRDLSTNSTRERRI